MVNNLNLQEINQEQAFDLSKFFIRSKQNLFIFGRRGLGKTEIILQSAKECNIKVNYINLSVIERPDLAGYPDMQSAGDVIVFKSPHFLPKLINDNTPDSLLLFDEVDKASPEVTAPLLEILQFRKINGVPINASACILTGNLVNERAYSNQISTALLDRGAKYILSFDFDKWAEWAKKHEVHDLILGFLRSNPEFACGSVEESCYASPSPRGWTQASEALLRARDLKIVDIDTVTHIISGFVGSEAGLRFKLWYEHFRKFEPSIHSLIDSGNLNINFHDLAPTEKIIFTISACYYAKQKVINASSKSKNKFASLDNLCNFFINYKIDYELQVMGLYNSFTFEMITKNKIYESKSFFELFTKISEQVSIKK